MPGELPQGGTQTDGSWQFTDDLGTTTSLPAAPTKVVAYIGFAAALYDLCYEVAGYFGPARNDDGSTATIAGNLPIDVIPSVAAGDDGYTVDVEKVINLGAELFIGPNYDLSAQPPVIWPLDADTLAQIALTTPVIHIAQADGADVERTIDSIANLATALGVDPETPDVATAREAYLASHEALADAIAAKPNLTCLWMAGSATGFWISVTTSDVQFLRTLGAQPAPGTETLVGEQSWETFGELAVDLIFNDDRQPAWWGVEQLTAEIPTYSHNPAVASGQVVPWRNTFVPSYANFTPILDEYTKVFLDADEDVVS